MELKEANKLWRDGSDSHRSLSFSVSSLIHFLLMMSVLWCHPVSFSSRSDVPRFMSNWWRWKSSSSFTAFHHLMNSFISVNNPCCRLVEGRVGGGMLCAPACHHHHHDHVLLLCFLLGSSSVWSLSTGPPARHRSCLLISVLVRGSGTARCHASPWSL